MTGSRPTDPVFRRVVIGFHDASGSPSALEAAVRFARMMETELLGVFVEDVPLLEWSTSSLVRHIVTGAVRAPLPATPDSLAADFATAAVMVRQRLSRIAGVVGVDFGFRVERASAASLDFGGTEPGDLLVVVEPADPMARLCYPFAGILRAVAASSAPVLYMPHRVLERRGPVVAITRQSKDPGYRIAADIAATIGESLIDLRSRDEAVRQYGDQAAGERATHLSIQDIDRALDGVRERLLVVSRPASPVHSPVLFAAIASQRMIPTLIVGTGGPDAEAGKLSEATG